MKQYRTVAQRAARLAGDALMKRFQKLTSSQVQKKGAHDLVTKADMEANTIIIRTIKKAFPDHDFLSEETGSEDRPGDYLWTIDPLDGTINYRLQSPLFCTAIALMHGEDILLSVIHAPYMKEFFYAEHGRGAYLNDKKISVSSTRNIQDALVMVGRTHDRESHKAFFKLQQKLDQAVLNVRRLGSGSMDMAYTAAGRADATIFTPPGITKWDAPAGALLIREAGGIVTDMQGKPWNCNGHGLVASNKRIHRALLKSLS